MKTAELTGVALDWAVAKCEPDDTLAIYFDEDTGEPLCHDDWEANQEYKPSTNWAQGGPIIEREEITVCWQGEIWVGSKFNVRVTDEYEFHQTGTTPLIAAMRCYVASKLGDEVEIPKGLV